jgi:hypothetical protein
LIRTIKKLDELGNLQPYWERWQNHPNSDFAHFRLVCQLRKEVECPHVTVVDFGEKPSALLAARIEYTHFLPAVGYFKLIRIPARVLSVIYGGLLGEINDQNGKLMAQHLLSSFGLENIDAITFSQLSELSPLYSILLQEWPNYLIEKGKTSSAHWEMDLPKESAFHLKKLNAKFRSNMRGKKKKLEAEYPGKVRWRWMRAFDNIPGLCSRLEEVAAHTYHRALGAGFIDDEEHRQRFSLFARRNQLRVLLLEIEGKVRAFWIGQVYNNIFHSEATGYDDKLSRYRPGTLVLMHMIDELAQEGVQKIDFGLGDAFYKQRFGDRSWQERTLTVFPRTAKGLVLRGSLRVC